MLITVSAYKVTVQKHSTVKIVPFILVQVQYSGLIWVFVAYSFVTLGLNNKTIFIYRCCRYILVVFSFFNFMIISYEMSFHIALDFLYVLKSLKFFFILIHINDVVNVGNKTNETKSISTWNIKWPKSIRFVKLVADGNTSINHRWINKSFIICTSIS